MSNDQAGLFKPLPLRDKRAREICRGSRISSSSREIDKRDTFSLDNERRASNESGAESSVERSGAPSTLKATHDQHSDGFVSQNLYGSFKTSSDTCTPKVNSRPSLDAQRVPERYNTFVHHTTPKRSLTKHRERRKSSEKKISYSIADFHRDMEKEKKRDIAVLQEAEAIAAQHPKPKKFMNGQIVPGTYAPRSDELLEKARHHLNEKRRPTAISNNPTSGFEQEKERKAIGPYETSFHDVEDPILDNDWDNISIVNPVTSTHAVVMSFGNGPEVLTNEVLDNVSSDDSATETSTEEMTDPENILFGPRIHSKHPITRYISDGALIPSDTGEDFVLLSTAPDPLLPHPSPHPNSSTKSNPNRKSGPKSGGPVSRKEGIKEGVQKGPPIPTLPEAKNGAPGTFDPRRPKSWYQVGRNWVTGSGRLGGE